MQTRVAIACLALLTVAFAGCAEDAERYPDGVSATSSSSRSGTATGSATSTRSSTATSTGPAGNGTGNETGQHAPTAYLTATPASGAAPLNASFNLTGSDADGDALQWTLAFGDGNSTNGTELPTTVLHQYLAEGNYTAVLNVTDGNRTGTSSVVVSATGGGGGEPVDPMDALCPTDANAVALPSGHYATPMDTATAPGDMWIYEESNDRPGLQRNDATMPTECPIPDTIIF